jgi:hypothetical protein
MFIEKELGGVPGVARPTRNDAKGKGDLALSPKSGNLKKRPRSQLSRKQTDNTYREEVAPDEVVERQTKQKQNGRVGPSASAKGNGKAAMRDQETQ